MRRGEGRRGEEGRRSSELCGYKKKEDPRKASTEAEPLTRFQSYPFLVSPCKFTSSSPQPAMRAWRAPASPANPATSALRGPGGRPALPLRHAASRASRHLPWVTAQPSAPGQKKKAQFQHAEYHYERVRNATQASENLKYLALQEHGVTAVVFLLLLIACVPCSAFVGTRTFQELEGRGVARQQAQEAARRPQPVRGTTAGTASAGTGCGGGVRGCGGGCGGLGGLARAGESAEDAGRRRRAREALERGAGEGREGIDGAQLREQAAGTQRETEREK